jgi:hypothetical protein
MSKKTMLLALTVASMTMFALPAAAAAAELHWEGVSSFSGDATAGSLVAEGEPTITCETGHVTGTPSAGGTTGTISFDFTGCHTTVFGLTAKCKTNTAGGLDNTMKAHGTYHLITTTDGPAMLITFETKTLICAGISNTITHGNLIGTIISPKCGETSNKMTINFSATGTSQDHKLYTGVNYDLTATTGEGGAAKTAAWSTLWHIESPTAGKLNCT